MQIWVILAKYSSFFLLKTQNINKNHYFVPVSIKGGGKPLLPPNNLEGPFGKLGLWVGRIKVP